jgi:D-citramalate synthase
MHLIEAGSACTSEGEREAIRRVADEGLDATVTSFARGVKADIDHALDCGVDGINLVVPASDKHVETKVGSTRDDVVETTVELVEYATDHGLWVEVLGEDGSAPASTPVQTESATATPSVRPTRSAPRRSSPGSPTAARRASIPTTISVSAWRTSTRA